MVEHINNYLSVTEIAEILEISREAVHSWLKKGYIKYSWVGKLQKVRAEELMKYLEGLGNSKTAMANFERNIRDYLREKQEARR